MNKILVGAGLSAVAVAFLWAYQTTGADLGKSLAFAGKAAVLCSMVGALLGRRKKMRQSALSEEEFLIQEAGGTAELAKQSRTVFLSACFLLILPFVLGLVFIGSSMTAALIITGMLALILFPVSIWLFLNARKTRRIARKASRTDSEIRDRAKSRARTQPSPSVTPDSGFKPSPQLQALIAAVRERSASDPLIGAKVGSKEIFQRLLHVLRDDKGIHMGSLLCAVGALAGYSCQASLRAQAIAHGEAETARMQTVTTEDGRHYFFGDALNQALAQSQQSVWSLAAAAARDAGAKELPDLSEIFQHTSASLGTEHFGCPRTPEEHSIGTKPAELVAALWPALQSLTALFCPDPEEWPVLFGIVSQHAINRVKDGIAPSLALKIVMENAVPMSKIELGSHT